MPDTNSSGSGGTVPSSAIVLFQEGLEARRARLWGKPAATAKPSRDMLLRRLGRLAPIMAAIPLRPVAYITPIMRPGRSIIEWKRITREIANKHGVQFEDIGSYSRLRPICHARHEAFYRLRTEITRLGKPISLPEIGRLFHRDHTTVLHGIRVHCQRTGEPLPC